MRYIIFPNQERVGGISCIIPSAELSIEEIARKDVPAGLPYLFVTADQLPDDTFFNAWEADFSTPDGYGIGADAWFAEQANKETNQ